MSDIVTTLKAKDEASTVINRVKQNLEGFGAKANSAVTLGGLTSSLANIQSILVGGGVVAGVASVTSAVWELGAAGAQVMRTRDAFEDLADSAGSSGTAMLAAMREASRGTVADSQLMAAANRALVLEVADDAKTMGDLVEAAIYRGRQVGVGATQAVNDLVTGIGRMSPEILDNLGIANAKGAFAEYATSLGTTADKLTEVQKKQALVNATLASVPRDGAAVADDAAAAFERMDTSIQNAKDALGELFGPAMAQIAANLADAVTESMDAATTSKTEAAQGRLYTFGEEITRLAQKMQDLKALSKIAELGGDNTQFSRLQADIANTSTQLQVYVDNWNEAAALTGAPLIDRDAIKQGTIAYLSAADAAALLTQTQNETAHAGEFLAEAERRAGAAAAAMQGQVAQAGAAVDAIRGKFVQAAIAGMNASEAMAGYMRYTKLGHDVEVLRSQLARYFGEEEIQFQVDLFIENALNSADDLTSKFTDIETAGVGAASAVGKEFDSLKGKLEGVLQQGLNLDVSWPGKDQNNSNRDLNENARRMAAIANEGLIGQDWLDEMAAEVPGAYADLMLKIAAGMDAKSAAQSIMRDFQDGLRPDMLDRDAAKDRVRRMLLGEASMAEMASQLAAELSTEMGVSLASAQAAANSVLGVSGGAPAAGDLQQGLSNATNGKALVDQIAGQMEAAADRLKTTGERAGQVWGVGFMGTVESSVSVPLISLLVRLVTPAVMQAFATNATLTGTQD